MHNSFKYDLMTNTWRAFVCVCEAVMHVAFKVGKGMSKSCSKNLLSQLNFRRIWR